ncbi:MAG: sugar phosphate nucleotidyltransferase [Candidatus Palauibacterales bacterium]|nr:sugar phosphate nucleotidyltransferase [Candidatus Palauibacterales bacterium]
MIFAAGLGTRLYPLTRDTPKALIELGAATLLEIALDRLTEAGCTRIVVNVHHHADRIVEFFERACPEGPGATGEPDSPWSWRGAWVLISHEPDGPLETGGGLLHAAGLFRGDRTILLHNVDVISDIDLTALAREHEASGKIATLAVNRRPSGRLLVFDEDGLCGRVDSRTGVEEWARRPSNAEWRAAFTGVHAVSPRILGRLADRGVFSIVRSYLRLAAAGAGVMPFDVSGAAWMDVGTPGRLDAATRRLAGGK